MTTNETENEYKDLADHENRLKNAQPKYLTEGKKRYLLASSQESIQALMDNQNAELTGVLIALKTEHDQIKLESAQIQRQIDEYDKQIKMFQQAEVASKANEEKQKKEIEFMNDGINAKKERKGEEEYNKKSLLKQRDKINKDLLILQKEIIKYENESQALDKKIERAGLDQNLIKEKKNQVHSKIENQKQKNDSNQNEYDLKIKQYKKMIELRSAFLKFSDDRKEIQNQIAQKAKNDALDKQEVEKRIKFLKENLVSLKNNLLVKESTDKKELEIDSTTNPEDEIKIIQIEKEKNRNLLELGKKYNEVEKAYQLVMQNITSMVETEKQNPLNIQLDKEEKQNNFDLTNNELKNYEETEVKKEEFDDLDKYELNEEEKRIVESIKELNEKEIYELEKAELDILNKIIKKDSDDKDITEEDIEIINEILSTELTEEEEIRAKKIELSEEEEKVALQKLKKDEKELTSEKKKQKLDYLREIKMKYRKFKLHEKQKYAPYKIKKIKKNKDDLVNNYEFLLKKVAKSFDALYLCHSKQEFLNMMKEKQIDISGSATLRKNQPKKTTRRSIKKFGKRGSVNKRYSVTESKPISGENKDEEDDKSNYDPDIKILNKFMKEQNKEKENFISGKIKLEDKNN